MRLIVDGIDTHSKKVSGGERSSIKPPLHIGGVPADLAPAPSVNSRYFIVHHLINTYALVAYGIIQCPNTH